MSSSATTKASGVTVWLTGLSGAGKSTLASALAERLRDAGVPTEVLDGDDVRRHLSRGLGFSREDRDLNVERIAYVAGLLTRHGVVAITAAISPYADARAAARRSIGAFVEVHVHASLDACVARDPKDLYRRALAGEIAHFTGVSDPYEAPTSPELRIDTERESIDEGVDRVLALLAARGHLAPEVAARA